MFLVEIFHDAAIKVCFGMYALNCIFIFSFNCRTSFIPDDGLRISRNVE